MAKDQNTVEDEPRGVELIHTVAKKIGLGIFRKKKKKKTPIQQQLLETCTEPLYTLAGESDWHVRALKFSAQISARVLGNSAVRIRFEI